MIISIQNNLDKLPTTQYSYLTNTAASGGTAFPVRNINPFSASHAIQIGKTGEAQSEILVLSSSAVTGTAINTTTTGLYSHALDSVVYDIHYNKLIIKRSTSGSLGTATALATVSITPNSEFTEYEDASGVSTYAYKTAFYNSVTGDTSTDSDWFIPGGPTFYSLQKLRSRVKNRLYNADYIKSDDVIDEWINEWLEEMNNAAIKVNKDYLLGTTSLSFGTSGLGTITAQDFMYPRKIEITTDGANYTPTTLIPVNEYSDGDYFSPNQPRHSWKGDTVLQFLPTGVAGTARIIYSKGEAVLTTDSSELPFPMRACTRSFVNYALHCAYENDQKDDLSNSNYTKAQKIKADFINEIIPRDQTGPHTIMLTESLSGMNDGMAFEDDYIV